MKRRQLPSSLVSSLLLGGVLLLASLTTTQAQQSALPQPAPGARLTLDDAIALAVRNEPAFAAASADARVTALLRKDARAALLPALVYHNQVLYTQPSGPASRIAPAVTGPVVFIANNSVREYTSQGVVTETLGLAQIGALRLANANAARAAAELEIARRGLVATVVNLYYGVTTEAEKTAVAARALAESDRFVEIAQQREASRETAHADVIKAQLQQQQRQRDVAEAKLLAERARLELGVLLYPDPATPYDVVPASAPAPLADRGTVEAAARAFSPALRSALASLQATQADIYAARAALLPSLGLNAIYGIDAPQFARYGSDNTRFLGYAGSATLDIPVWDWLTSVRKIKEIRIYEGAAKTLVSAAQRRLLADLAEFYAEAETARTQLTSLDTSVLAARESLRLTNLRYTAGEATVLEVADAQNTVIIAENSQLDQRLRYQVALAQLQTLTGSF